MSDWQPIETAPKDGQSILIATPSGTVISAVWYAGGWDVDHTGSGENWATHWMPLPPAPIVEERIPTEPEEK